MPVGDIYRVKMFQRLFSQQVLNVFYYVAHDVLCTAVGLLDSFEDHVQIPILQIQNVSLTYEPALAENLMEPDDFATRSFEFGAVVGGECLPSFASWGFRLNRSTTLIRNGSKRIAAIPESFQNNGVVTSGGVVAVADVATALAATLTDTAGATYHPAIFHKDTGALGGGNAFEFVTATYMRITTQNTRKIGRGA